EDDHAELFEKYGVLSRRELQSRQDIYLERYIKDVNTEALLCLGLARTTILPAAYRYQGELATTAASVKSAVGKVDTSSLDRVTGLVADLEAKIKGLDHAMAHHSNGTLIGHAKH